MDDDRKQYDALIAEPSSSSSIPSTSSRIDEEGKHKEETLCDKKDDLFSQPPQQTASSPLHNQNNSADPSFNDEEFSDAILDLVRPAILRLNHQVQLTGQSQQALTQQIEEITKVLKSILEQQKNVPLSSPELEPEVKQRLDKLEAIKRRTITTAARLKSIQGRIAVLKRTANQQPQSRTNSQRPSIDLTAGGSSTQHP